LISNQLSNNLDIYLINSNSENKNQSLNTHLDSDLTFNSSLYIIFLILKHATDEFFSDNSRHLGLLILKNLINKNMKLNNFQILWNFLTVNIKSEIQMSSLALLASRSGKIKNAASTILSILAVFYVKDNNYDEFLNMTDNLFNIFSNNTDVYESHILNPEIMINIDFKESSLKIFAMIMEELYYNFHDRDEYLESKGFKLYIVKIITVILQEITNFHIFPIPNDSQFSNNEVLDSINLKK